MIKILWTGLIIASLSLLTWAGLLLGRGKFWAMSEKIGTAGETTELDPWPSIQVIIPARNEGTVLPRTLPSVLNQDYPGDLRVTLVDDHSEDNTGEIARSIARETDSETELEVTEPPETPAGWTGKVWALHRGFQKAEASRPQLIWLTDADILHSPETARKLTVKLIEEDLSLASVMADLQTDSFWEKLLIPNFVYYFSMIYPFSWVNDFEKETAAAAGGCVLVRRTALEEAGGFSEISRAVIDDCALAREINDSTEDGIWLGLSHLVKSLRSYGSLGEIWRTISRSAFSQLNYSVALLFGTVIGMFLLFLVPPASVGLGLFHLIGASSVPQISLAGILTGVGGLTWLIAGGSLIPILRWYELTPAFSFLAPVGGFLYTLMTIDSGLRWWTGKGSRWKGRAVATEDKEE